MIVRALLKIVLRLYNIIVYVFNILGLPSKITLNWNFRVWNYFNWKKKFSNLIEWNYHMVFTDEIIGSFGLCVVNPNKLPVIPNGLVIIAYGVFKKKKKPFTLFRMIPISCMTESKSWPSSIENPMEFQYLSENHCRIQVANLDWSVYLDITYNDNCLSTYYIHDNNTGPLGQHWTVTYPWELSKATVTGTLTTVKPDGATRDPRCLKGLAYFENTGGCTFLINIAWFFLVHTTKDFSFSFQSYYRSPNLTNLLLFYNQNKIIFDRNQIEIINIDEVIHDMRDYSQLVPKTCTVIATNSTYKLELNFVIEHYVEAEKNNPGEKANIFLKNFFIQCLVGRFSGALTIQLEGRQTTIKFDDCEFCGEYAKHNLYHESFSRQFLPR